MKKVSYAFFLFALAIGFLAPPQLLQAATVNGTLGIDPGSLAGADAAGRVMVFTPNPVEPGSSVSHWTTQAFPNLLMEPSINSDLDAEQLDLTIFQMRDVGWSAGTSTVTLRITDPAGQGFNDPTLGPQRLAAMQRVAELWSNRLQSSVEINVEIGFDALECSDQGGVLAQAGAQFLFESFAGAPFSDTWYHGALAESLSGENLSLEDVADPNAGDLVLIFNEDIDDACLGDGRRFSYNLNGNIPDRQISFINVALHEMAHGLGFATFVNDATGVLFMGSPDIYTRFLFDNTQGQTWSQMTNAQRRTSAINTGGLVWNGPRVTAQAPNFLSAPPALVLNAPASIAGSYAVGVANFGPTLTQAGVTGDLVVAVDASASPGLLCEAVANTADVAGKIAMLDRGDCDFTVKVKNAQDAGAIGVVVVNNVAGDPINMGGTNANIVIPSLQVSRDDGNLIKAAMGQTAEPGVLRFNAGSFSVDEDAGTATITVRRASGTDGTVTVDYATSDGSATAGADYQSASGTLTFSGGQGGTRSFQVGILDDSDTEGEETVELVLSNPTGGATLGSPAQVSLGIADDDLNAAGFLAFSSSTFQTHEGAGTVAVTVERTGGVAGAVSVGYATGGGSATAGTDYVSTSGTLNFADGEESKSFTVAILDDANEESVETIGLALSNPTGGVLLGTPSSALIDISDNESCQPNSTRLCLNQGRFRVEVNWRNFQDGTGNGEVVLDSNDSGLLYFFDPDNWEMLVKVLDGCALNDRFWVFAAATTNVEYTLEVTDTLTGTVKEYTNPLGVSAPAVTDTNAFATCSGNGVSSEEPAATSSADSGNVMTTLVGVPSTTKRVDCEASTTRLCLNQGRFQIEVDWRNFQDGTGSGEVAFDSDDSGLLYFFDPDNWEMLVKVLDGCAINGNFWVFAAATTNVEYTLTVTDTNNGQVMEYTNPLGVSSSAVTDTGAFTTCP
jgi:hypothetical protein